MSSLAAIDPGVHTSAFAVFIDGVLTELFFSTPQEFGGLTAVDAVIIENPRINGQTRGKRPNDLMNLALSAGELYGVAAMRFNLVPVLVEPAVWKGQIKKPIHHLRVWRELSALERQTLAAVVGKTPIEIALKIQSACQRLARTGKVSGYSWAAHNLLDAVGLGLFHLKRLGRAGVRR